MKSPLQTAAVTSLLVCGCAHQAAQPSPPVEAVEMDDSRAPRLCAPATTEKAAADGRIAQFSSGMALNGGIVAYPVGDKTAPKFASQDGALHITADVPLSENAQYVGVAMLFPKCVDASAFTGVRFTIRGSYQGCTMHVAVNDVAHTDRTIGDTYAAGNKGSYPPQIILASGQVTPTARTIQIPFVDNPYAENAVRGNPPQALDKSQLTQVVWQFTIGTASNVVDATRCTADVRVGDLMFY